MRPTRLVATSTESFADATRQLINMVMRLSGSVKHLHIMEDTALRESPFQYNVKAHIVKRK